MMVYNIFLEGYEFVEAIAEELVIF